MAAATTAVKQPLALIVGVGDGLSSSLARLFFRAGYRLAFAARNTDKLSGLCQETEATAYACDATKEHDVASLFAKLRQQSNSNNSNSNNSNASNNAAISSSGCDLDVVIYNPSLAVRAPIQNVDPNEVRKALDVNAFGSFLVAQQAAKWMLERRRTGTAAAADGKKGCDGTILFTGASAGTKGFAKSAAFAMGKHAQRGLAESMARELHPQNIHVCWICIDGPIRIPGRVESSPDSMLDPDAIAQTYLDVVNQHRSAWTNELTIRPWVEKW